MTKEINPFLSDEFLDEVVKEINQLYGGDQEGQNDVPIDNEDK